MTARDARTVRLGAAGVAAILIYVLIVDPWLVRRSERGDALAAAEARLGRLVALERSLPALRTRLAEARALWADEVEPRLLPGQAAAVAASSASSEVRGLAEASLLDVEREDPLPAREEDGLTAVPVQFSLRGDVYGLRDFLGALETADTFLHPSELRVISSGEAFLAPANVPGAPLQVTVTLEGYLGGAPVMESPAGMPESDPVGVNFNAGQGPVSVGETGAATPSDVEAPEDVAPLRPDVAPPAADLAPPAAGGPPVAADLAPSSTNVPTAPPASEEPSSIDEIPAFDRPPTQDPSGRLAPSTTIVPVPPPPFPPAAPGRVRRPPENPTRRSEATN